MDQYINQLRDILLDDQDDDKATLDLLFPIELSSRDLSDMDTVRQFELNQL